MPMNPATAPERTPTPQHKPTERVTHRVQFYVSDRFLARRVTGFLTPALERGARALVIATAAHKQMFEEAFGDGPRLHALEAAGRLKWIDAGHLLERLLVNDWPDETRFLAAVAPLVDGVPGPIFAFGEMADLLCQTGRPEASVRLEALWNGLLDGRDIALLCAHSMRNFADARQAELFHAVCECHSQVSPAEIERRSPDARAREVAALQQQGWALQGELRERIKMEVALGDAQRTVLDTHRRRDRFLATLAHELRNPLAPMQNAVQILRATTSSNASFTIEVIDRQVRQMTRLIDDLLDLSRITNGRIELQVRRIAVRDVVQAALETSRPVIDRAGQEIVVTMPPASLHVEADLTRMAQALANVLDNAAKFTQRGGRITLNAERIDNEAVIVVSDTGIGLQPEMLDRVFEMFTQARQERERAPGGLGIGLTVARRLVEMHSGRITAASGGPGRGSTFRISLPLAPNGARLPVARDDSSGRGPAAPAGLRVLVVDDNVDSAATMAMFLEISGHTVRTAYDGVEAVTAAGEFRPDVALMDIGLPGMTGHEAGRAIRAESWGSGVVLIALSGWGRDTDKQQSREAGFNHHLVKPVDHAQLSRILAQAAEARGLRQDSN